MHTLVEQLVASAIMLKAHINIWSERGRVPHRQVALDVLVETSILECN